MDLFQKRFHYFIKFQFIILILINIIYFLKIFKYYF